jgi:2-polyprenyl-3-methyl-5-hydroxy-6-metoxy-1,4-benzoquinol methylase
MDSHYYKEYYHLERTNWWFKVRSIILQQSIAKLLPSPTDNMVLNVGVATGATSEMLATFGNVMSVEYDKECYEFTKTILNSPLMQGSILELPFEAAQYDLVCAFDVIEHVENDSLAIAEMKRVCKKGGMIAITVPAFMSLWGQHDVVNQHYRRYRMHEVEKLLNEGEKGQLTYKTYFNSLLFIPLFFFRKILGLLSKNLSQQGADHAQSDHAVVNVSNMMNKLLQIIFGIEIPLLHSGLHFPFGVSALLIWKKD